MLDVLKLVFCAPFLLFSCHSDIRTRRVSNDVWKVMIAGGVLFVLYDLSQYGMWYLLRLLISVGFIYVFVYILFQIGTLGGADAKSLIVVSFILPAYPTFRMLGYSFPLNPPLIDLFPFGIFGNAVLLTIAVPLGLALFNVVTLGRNIDHPLYIFIGYKTRISELAGRHIRLIQEFEERDGAVHTRFKRGGAEIHEETMLQLKNLVKRGLMSDSVWVTPSLPFMIPITLGFFVAAFYGDLVFELMKYMMQ